MPTRHTPVMRASVVPAPCQVPVSDPAWRAPWLCRAAAVSALVSVCVKHAFPKCSGASLDSALFHQSAGRTTTTPKENFFPKIKCLCSLGSIPDLLLFTLHTLSPGWLNSHGFKRHLLTNNCIIYISSFDCLLDSNPVYSAATGLYPLTVSENLQWNTGSQRLVQWLSRAFLFLPWPRGRSVFLQTRMSTHP